ncbi:MAG: biotin/lipoyl attachment [Pseudomonadota bacterium]
MLRAPAEGLFTACATIGDEVKAGDTVGEVRGTAVKARIDGVLRGLIKSGLNVALGCKLGDIDPTGRVENCFSISDKARAVAGGVLEAVLNCRRQFPMDSGQKPLDRLGGDETPT